MASGRLCQELLTCIFEHILSSEDGGAESSVLSTSTPYQLIAQQQAQQRHSAQTKRLRSASEQQVAGHSKHPISKRTISPHGTLCSVARVCRDWNTAATKLLYNDPGHAISRYEGLYLPHLLFSLQKDPFLRACVRAFTVTAS